ncbi:hypothetical protein DVH05_017973 [Phytophthora capsici]|nr:hypothetical protein DVH05_017973 [Phytophthora capsici]
MKLFTSTIAALVLLAAIANGDDVGQSEIDQQTQQTQEYQVGQVSPASQVGQDSPDQESPVQQNDGTCTLSGTYVNGTDVSQCSSIIIDSLSVPAGVMLDLTNVTEGANIKFQGTTTFGPKVRVRRTYPRFSLVSHSVVYLSRV